MAKVTLAGIFSVECGFPQKPPAGVKAICHHCFAELETTENEEKVEFVRRKDTKSGMHLPGWKISCPECNRKVFFFCEAAVKDVLKRINQLKGGGK